ncbi:hypothetical protein BHE74_00034951 [Ensete ventricosum]|uniref:Uncharacterized protein n=1 Tax=Ensete ventricosum TaxID=4639 RepID=A0A427AB14_ENSVE|nr:hypothetical protein B296_00033395 [Ensete ventricosum]RWW58216.1 hypothetical protein BHE74_00034951 [Ensete ventricosum]
MKKDNIYDEYLHYCFLLGAPETNFQVDSSLNSKSLLWRVPEEPWRLISSGAFQKQLVHVKASQNTSALTTNANCASLNAADTNEKNATATLQKKNVYKSTFPSGFQVKAFSGCF